MQKITPFLWFDTQAEEAVNYYPSIFKNSKVLNVARYGEAGAKASGMPEGTVMTVDFQLEGQRFVALNGGPIFSFTPAVSFFVSCGTRQEIDGLWGKLSQVGKVLMELDKYPFAEKYGWLQDKYGISWQLILVKEEQKITPFLMFCGEQQGRAEEAMNFYVSVFPRSKINAISRYGKGEKGPEGEIVHAVFSLNGQEFMAMDSAVEQPFTFTPAVSFVVDCGTQKEVDYYWDKLTPGGDEKAQQCGWLQDKYGVSWQVVPTVLDKMLRDKDSRKSEAVMKVMLPMKKLDIAALKRAYKEA